MPHDYRAIFLDRLTAHRARIASAGPGYDEFLQEHLSDEILAVLASQAAGKMALTASDGEEHSMMLSRSPVSYVVCTVPVAPSECASWYEHRFGGYLKVLEGCWNSNNYRAAGAEVLCHVTYGLSGEDAWINVSIFPIRSTQFNFQPVLATDLLSSAEKAELGVL